MYRKITTLVMSIALTFAANANLALAQVQTFKQNEIEVKKIDIRGNTVFSDSELEKITAPVEGQKITIERLFQIKNRIEQYYLDRGYISSGAFLPQQKIESGDIAIEVVEGSLAVIEIEGLSGLSEKYVTARLPKLEQPLKVDDLAQALTRLKEDPLIKEIAAELKLLEPGKNLLSLRVNESKPIKTQLSFVNTFSPTIGSLGGSANVMNQNLLGFGDRASINYTRTEGLERYEVGYSFPFNASGGRIDLNYNNADSELIEEAISALDINADYQAYKLSIRQPIINRQTEKLNFSVELEKLESETFIAEDFSFSFVDGLEDGVSRITPLRISQEYIRRGNSNLVAAESQFNVGLDLFDATKNESGIDGSFWSWQGNFQWLKAFDEDGDWLLRTNLSTQLSPDNLLPLEQLTVGGVGSVRGYRQNLIVGDNGIVAVAEGQVPVVRSARWGKVFIVPFVDFGTIWRNYSEPTNTQSNTLASLGLELNYRIEDFLDARTFYGIPLLETEDFGDNSSEKRWGFSISVTPFEF